MKFTTLNAIAGLAATLPTSDEASVAAARARQNSLTKPPGALGRLETLAEFMAGWRKTICPEIKRAQALVFAGNHGVCAQGVNPYPQEVTAQMVLNFESGGAAINQLCRVNGAALRVIPLELDRPTQDFTQGPAMSEAETLAAMQAGADAVDTLADVLILGEMGIGNSTVAAAMAAALFGGEVSVWVGAGTGSDSAGIARKIGAIDAGLALHSARSGMAVLASLGGREQAAICGAVLAARAAGIVVILDGFICTAAAAALYTTDQRLLDHCLVGHQSSEPGVALPLNLRRDAFGIEFCP
ncbi:MAG: nicotinate-nucleotide--dimethylbenzimidazole phosphoribosyltransferase [Sulfitobacter sp.]|nr:MAG: nicotinate-nucleotide--dimethylbenzimidazole phosphoribosyltransferase [Sulfitobacter sp.]